MQPAGLCGSRNLSSLRENNKRVKIYVLLGEELVNSLGMRKRMSSSLNDCQDIGNDSIHVGQWVSRVDKRCLLKKL